MKNKKVLNLYLLVLSLISLVTFILPFEKISPTSLNSVAVNVVYYITNTLLVISLSLIVLMTMYHLFTDKYDGVKICLSLSLIAFLMVLINTVIYAASINFALSYGYLILIVEVFILFSFNQIVKIVTTFDEVVKYALSIFSFKSKNSDLPKIITKSKKSSCDINNKEDK